MTRSRATRRRFIRRCATTAAIAGSGVFGRLDRRLEEALPSTRATNGDGPSETGDTDWEPAQGSPLEADVGTVTAVTDLEVPWDMTFAGDDVFVTERPGGVRRFDLETLSEGDSTTADEGEVVLAKEDLPEHTLTAAGPTLGLESHPEYPDVAQLFVYYGSEEGDNRVVRYDFDTNEMETIIEDIPSAPQHDGGRIRFDSDHTLWIPTGDAGDPAITQDPSSLGGATLRITADGEPVGDEPAFPDGDERTYTIGHRNPQGLTFTPDGTPIVAEHGPVGRDEVSALYEGGNYGWDEEETSVRGGPDDPEYESYTDHDDITAPIVNTGPEVTWAPSGCTFYDAEDIPEWTNRLFVAGLISETVFVVTLVPAGTDEEPVDDDGVSYDDLWLDGQYTATVHHLFEGEFGRLRHAERGPDGALYLLTSNHDERAEGEFPVDDDDRIIRVEPA